MRLDEPSWWYPPLGATAAKPVTWPAHILAPLAAAYGAITARRMARAPAYKAARPVVCVGNLTVGGTGKTPLSITVAGLLAELGAEAWFLTRGYGGSARGPHRVDPAVDTAARVGDEPLLLAAHGAVVVARDRATGAAFIDATAPANAVIIMDDGLQNPALAKNLTLCVVDQRRGIGNGRVFPAGPLRAPVAGQLAHVDAIIVMQSAGSGEPSVFDAAIRAGFPGPVLAAATEPVLPAGGFGDAPHVAFAGIANPDRFFDLLAANGATIVERRRFPDHHALTGSEAAALLTLAESHGAALITTAKDHARLRGTTGAVATLAERSQVLPIATVLDARDRERLASLLRGAIARK